jgi:hypothetical protein
MTIATCNIAISEEIGEISLLFFPRLAEWRGLSQGEQHHLFSRHRADVVVQTHHFDAGDVLHHRLHHRPCSLDQMGAHLLEQVPAFLGWERLDQVLLGGSQNALETNDNQVADQVGMNVLGTSAHVLLLEVAHPLRNGTFDFALSLHQNKHYSESFGDFLA